MLERVGARASRRCPAPAPGVRGAPGSSQHAKCSVGPAGEQVELSASPRRPAASPTRLSALADGALRSRHETSGAPALLSAAASRHARGSSGAPRPGSGGTITTAASPMRHELALPARLPCAPQQRGVEACAAALHAFERRTSFCCGWVVGWVTARKKIVGRLPRIWGSIFRDS